MIPLSTIRASNADLKNRGPGLVAVFVGGTSGIGESTLRAFVANTVQPRVYIVGRNETAAKSIINDVYTTINPKATCTFIACDATLLNNVKVACASIAIKEKYINLLFLSCGVLSFKGREETIENLDKRLTLSFYARFYFTHLLLPLLTAASVTSPSHCPFPSSSPHSSYPPLARVVSILSAGLERPFTHPSDLSLSKPGHYTLSAATAHATLLTDFAIEYLASQNPGVGFVHVYPGFVQTGQIPNVEGVGWFLRGLLRAGSWVVGGFLAVGVKEAGERGLWVGTGGRYAGRGGNDKRESEGGESGIVREGEGGVRNGKDEGKEELETEVGSDGVMRGSGAYLLKWDGTVVGRQEVLRPLRKQEWAGRVWEHAVGVFEQVNGAGDA